MRRIVIAVPVVLVVAVGGAAAWYFLRPHDPLAEARMLMARGDVRAAQLVLRAAVQADPTLAEAHLKLGQVQLRLGDPTAAEREFRLARDRGWDAHALTPLLAQAAVAQGHDEEALRDYTPDGLTPEQAAAVLVARAEAQLALKQPDAATASVAQAQKLAPKSLDTAMAAARLSMARNDRAAGQTHIDEALAIDPHALEALMLQAELRSANGDQQGALTSYAAALQQAQAAGSGGGAAAANIRIARGGLLLAMNKDAEARADVDAVLKDQPKAPLANFLSARLYARALQWKEADAALSAVGPVLPRLPGGNMMTAIVKASLNQPEQAVDAAERQVALTPGSLAAVKLLARLDLLQKRPDRAVAALSATPVKLDAEALDLLGGAYATGGQSDKALETLRQASALLPDDTRLLTRVAALEIAQGQPGRAVQTLDHALDLATPPAATAAVASAQPETAPQAVPASLQTTAPGAAAPASAPNTPTQAQTAAALVLAALQAGDIDRAVSALDRLREAHGDATQLAMLGGMVKLAQIDLSGARSAFEAAIKLDPKALPPRISLARVLSLQGHPDQAAAIYKEILSADPAQGDALTGLVNLLVATQPDQAVAAAETALKASPTNAGIVGGLASLYLRVQQPAKAIALLDDATAKAPDLAANQGLLTLRAQAQLAQGNRPEAERSLRAMLDAAPDNVLLRRQLAELLAGDKNYDDARAVLRDGLARSPGNGTLVAASVALAATEGGPAAATARAGELAQDPANPAAATLAGDVLMSQRKFAEAGAAYAARLAALPPAPAAKDPTASDPAATLRTTLQIRAADAAASGGDAARAAAMLQDALAAHPDSPELALALSGLYLSANRLPEARTQLEAVLTRQPNNPAALNNLAWISQQQGDLGHARALAARAYLLGPTPQSADTLGWIMLAQDHVPDAVALLREASNGGAQDPAIQYHLAAALAKDGQKDAAVTLLKTVVAKPDAGFAEKPQAAKLLSELSNP